MFINPLLRTKLLAHRPESAVTDLKVRIPSQSPSLKPWTSLVNILFLPAIQNRKLWDTSKQNYFFRICITSESHRVAEVFWTKHYLCWRGEESRKLLQIICQVQWKPCSWDIWVKHFPLLFDKWSTLVTLNPGIQLSANEGWVWRSTGMWPWLTFAKKTVVEVQEDTRSKGMQDKSTKTKQKSGATENTIFSCSRKMFTRKSIRLLRKTSRELKRATQQHWWFICSKEQWRPTLSHTRSHKCAACWLRQYQLLLVSLRLNHHFLLQCTFLTWSLRTLWNLLEQTSLQRAGYVLTGKSG